MLPSPFMNLRNIVNDVQRITGFQQRMKFLMNTVIVQLKHIFLKELYPLLIPSNEKSVNFFNKEIVEILKSLLFFDLVVLCLFYFYSCDKGYAGARCERIDLFYLRGDRGQILVICLIAVMVIFIILVVSICTCCQ